MLNQALGERRDGRWAALEVGLLVPRQNGKGAVLEARELAGLFLFGEQLILHSAHLFRTAQEAFRRIVGLITATPDLERRVARISYGNGEEGIELKSGARLQFIARGPKAGRGLSADTLILDEAFRLDGDDMAALLPTLTTSPNPQTWYTSSAGDADSESLLAVRKRGLSGDDPLLCFLEYSADPACDPNERSAWAQANPGLGIRVSEEFVAAERAALPAEQFARERLGLWAELAAEQAIPADVWAASAGLDAGRLEPVAFGVTVALDRSRTVIGVAGLRGDGRRQVEVVAEGRGVAWAADWLAERVELWSPCAVVLDGTALPLESPLADRGVVATTTSARDRAQATVAFFDDLAADRVRRPPGEPLLDTAVVAARRKYLTDGWVWDGPGVAPLVAVTLAHYGLSMAAPPRKPLAPLLIRAEDRPGSETADLATAGF